MRTENENEFVHLDSIDYAALARAYKIVYFHSVGRSKILDLFFSEGSEDMESWTEEKNIPPETEERYRCWLQSNIERLEVDMAMRMVFGEIINSSINETDNECKKLSDEKYVHTDTAV